ncbi:MAG: LamB/YcsF family protein [Cyanobacteria bacterium]|nr:LamB/YcsF family protein [Cyanobacteriota bacterium]MDA1019997.1 LamB/YcsF family protein [Cyanobacteriota bacterium]
MTQTDPFISRQIDLNLDIGQGVTQFLTEQEIMPYATSVNVSTGAHAGEPALINKSLETVKENGQLALGALVSYPDLIGYGERKIQLSNEELRATILVQLGGLAALAKTHNLELQQVRTHGYLYQQMASNYSVAETVAKSIQEFSKWLTLIGPVSPALQEVGSWTNVRVAFEGRVDLRYKADGSVIPFDMEHDSNLDTETIAQRARDLVYKSVAKIENGSEIELNFQTIHLPSRIRNAVEIAKLVRGMVLKPLSLKTVDYEPYLSEFI